jgi:hypothetical protein
MAVKYRIKSTSDIFGQIELNISSTSYAGSVIELTAGGRDWIRLKYRGANNVDQVIISSKITFQFYVSEDFDNIELGEDEPRTWLVEVDDKVGNNIWTGWIDPDGYSEDYTNTPYIASLTASDGLDDLKNDSFTSLPQLQPLWDWFLDSISQTGLSLPYFESINIYDDEMATGNNDSPLVQAEVNERTFLAVGERVTHHDVITGILRPFFARIYQYRGWRIENIPEKGAAQIVRYFDNTGIFVSSSSIDYTVELQNQPANFRHFPNKNAKLGFIPSVNNSAVYFNTLVRDLSAEGLQGFQNAEDWTDSTNLKTWSKIGGLAIEQREVNWNQNQFALRIVGRNTLFNQTEYLESDPIPVDINAFNSLSISFAYWFNYQFIITFGSRPILYFSVIFDDGVNPIQYYSGANGAWQTNPTFFSITGVAGTRQAWNEWSGIIPDVPATGDLKIRFYKLVKSGAEGPTEIRITKFETDLSFEVLNQDRILRESGSSTGFVSNYVGPEFEHIVSDGTLLDQAGVMEVGGVLTSNWNRRGSTDNLNIRQLFLLQWLTQHSKRVQTLSGVIYQRGEWVTPLSCLKDKDSIRGVKHTFYDFDMGLASGFSNVRYREIVINDATVVFFTDFFSLIDFTNVFIDYGPRITVPGLSPGVDQNIPNFTIPPLVGDVVGAIGNTQLSASAIVTKPLVATSGIESSKIAFNAVVDEFETEGMSKTNLSDLLFSRPTKATPVTGDFLALIDSEDGNEIKKISFASLGTPAHNSLTGLQGGTTNQYYHLTETQYDAVIAANSPATGNPFATLADLGALGGGTVTSVSLTMPAIFSVSGSPVTTAGTLAVTLGNQSAFTVFARESGTGTPSFQSLLEGHLPNNISFTKLQDVTANRLLGRLTTDGKIEQLTATQVRTLLNVQDAADAYLNWVLTVTGTAGSQTVTSGSTVTITGTAPITAVRSGATVTLSHAVSGVTAGTYNNVTVNTLGHVTAGSNIGYITGNQTITLSGDVTGSGATSITATIANQAVTYAKIQNVTANRLLGRITTTGTAQELTATQVRTLLNVADGATANLGTVTSIATNNGVTGGTITGTGTIELTGQALALHNLATNGLIARTGAGTVAGRTLTGSTSISVTNGNGVSGNPTISAIFGTTAGTVAQGNDSRIINGQTAFGWGNHALVGYAVSGTGGSQVRTNTQLDGRYVLKAGDTMTGGLDLTPTSSSPTLQPNQISLWRNGSNGVLMTMEDPNGDRTVFLRSYQTGGYQLTLNQGGVNSAGQIRSSWGTSTAKFVAERADNNINANIEYRTTSGGVLAGQGDTGFFNIGNGSDNRFSSSSVFRVNASNGNVETKGMLQVNGAVNASQFYSEVITVTLPNNQTDTVLVKTFATADRIQLFATAVPLTDIDSGTIAYVGKRTSVSVTAITSIGYLFSGSGNNLNVRSNTAITQNTNVQIHLIYLNKI